MAILEWPGLTPVDQPALCAELDSLIRQVMDQQFDVPDAVDDTFARMAAALLALLELHEPDDQGYCPMCPDPRPPCVVQRTVHEYLRAPLTLVWWHELNRRGERLSIDEVGTWLAMAANKTPPHDRAA